MKQLFLFAFGILFLSGVSAQENINISGRAIDLVESGEGYWIFQDQQDTIIALNYNDFHQKVEKMEEQKLLVDKLKSTIEALEQSQQANEKYAQAADKNIQIQKQMIGKADSLYTGYKQLSQDIERISGMNAVSFVCGPGLYWYDQNNMAIKLNAGFEYHRIQLCGELGVNYKGINLTYRMPIRFRKAKVN